MPAEDHTSLVAFDAAVLAVCTRADDVAGLVQSLGDLYPVVATLVAAVTDGPPETLGARLTAGLDRIVEGRTILFHQGEEVSARAATPEDLPASKQVLSDFLLARGLPQDHADQLAEAVAEAAADLLHSDYPTADPVPAAAGDRDQTYGCPDTRAPRDHDCQTARRST